MYVKIPEKGFHRLMEAYVRAWNCAYLLDLMQRGAMTTDEESARGFVIEQLTATLTRMKEPLEAASPIADGEREVAEV